MIETYQAKKLPVDFELDGDYFKDVYADIKEITLRLNKDGSQPVQPTMAKLAWTDNALYVAFHCIDCEINAVMTGYNDLIYEEEAVEIFLDEDDNLSTYREIEVSPLNTVLDYYIINDMKGNTKPFARLHQVVKSAVKRDDASNYWSVEMAIPMSELIAAKNIPPKQGDTWRFNLYRIDRFKDVSKNEFSAWQPIKKNSYHSDPTLFGKLEFIL